MSSLASDQTQNTEENIYLTVEVFMDSFVSIGALIGAGPTVTKLEPLKLNRRDKAYLK